MTLTFGDQVKISRRLQKIARMVNAELTKATGGKPVPFSLITWGGNRSQYISNANRDEIKAGMRETLERWEENEDPPPHKRGS